MVVEVRTVTAFGEDSTLGVCGWEVLLLVGDFLFLDLVMDIQLCFPYKNSLSYMISICAHFCMSILLQS